MRCVKGFRCFDGLLRVYVLPFHLIWETQLESLFYVDREWSNKCSQIIWHKRSPAQFFFSLFDLVKTGKPHFFAFCFFFFFFISTFYLQKIYYCIVYQVDVFVKEVTHLDFFNVLCSMYAQSVGVTKHDGWVEHRWILLFFPCKSRTIYGKTRN